MSLRVDLPAKFYRNRIVVFSVQLWIKQVNMGFYITYVINGYP